MNLQPDTAVFAARRLSGSDDILDPNGLPELDADIVRAIQSPGDCRLDAFNAVLAVLPNGDGIRRQVFEIDPDAGPQPGDGLNSSNSFISSPKSWPSPPSNAAYHGLAGEIVRAIEPHTEADPVSLLIQVLAAYGNVIGRFAHFRAEADHHYANLFALLVGPTAKGGKAVLGDRCGVGLNPSTLVGQEVAS